MARVKGNNNGKNKEPAALENILWAAVDKLRGNMDAAEYKYVVLGLIFLKYSSDAFEEQHGKLLQEEGADPEDKDEYLGLQRLLGTGRSSMEPTSGHSQTAGDRKGAR